MNIIKLECKEDWILNGEVHFKKGKVYEGKWMKNEFRQGINTFYVKGDGGLRAGNFHSGSDYFDIPFGE